jgi:hypothetical protein
MSPRRLLIGSGAWLASFLFFAAALSGCVTPGGRFHGKQLPAEQQEALKVDFARVVRLTGTLYALQPTPCPVFVTVGTESHQIAVREIDRGLGGCHHEIFAGHDILAVLPDDQLLASLAHEWGHILHRDGATSPYSLRRAIPQIQKEREADEEAARLLSRISPETCRALVRLFSRAAEVEIGGGTTHPAYPDRVEAVTRACDERAAGATR